jgi:hypothetical protein
LIDCIATDVAACAWIDGALESGIALIYAAMNGNGFTFERLSNN